MCTEKKSLKEILIYGLIYPAILGSMIYDLFPAKEKAFVIELFSIQCLIVIMYIADYCHLYKNLKEKYTQEINKWYYYIPDVLVSISLWLAFKFADRNLFITIIAVTLVPIFFLIYILRLKYNTYYYIIYAAITILYGIYLTLFTSNEYNNVIPFITIISISYTLYVVVINCKKRNS